MKRIPLLVLSAGFWLLIVPISAAAASHHASSSPVKEVALTFDDGPYGTSTQQVLDILEKEGVHGTFFLIGQNVEHYPSLAKEIVQDGNVVGNHTYDHPKNLTSMPLHQVQEELSKTERAIASTTGVSTNFFRPPYGNLTKKLKREIIKEGYTIQLWNVDPRDWDYASSTSLVIEQHILSHLKTHMVIVLHDGRDTQIGYPRDNLIGALPIIIENLKRLGYRFVTVDALTQGA